MGYKAAELAHLIASLAFSRPAAATAFPPAKYDGQRSQVGGGVALRHTSPPLRAANHAASWATSSLPWKRSVFWTVSSQVFPSSTAIPTTSVLKLPGGVTWPMYYTEHTR